MTNEHSSSAVSSQLGCIRLLGDSMLYLTRYELGHRCGNYHSPGVRLSCLFRMSSSMHTYSGHACCSLLIRPVDRKCPGAAHGRPLVEPCHRYVPGQRWREVPPLHVTHARAATVVIKADI